jgi:hypothetical protein
MAVRSFVFSCIHVREAKRSTSVGCCISKALLGASLCSRVVGRDQDPKKNPERPWISHARLIRRQILRRVHVLRRSIVRTVVLQSPSKDVSHNPVPPPSVQVPRIATAIPSFSLKSLTTNPSFFPTQQFPGRLPFTS